MIYHIWNIYMFSIAIHLAALIVGVVTVGRFGYMFRASSPLRLLKDPIEQKYWIIALSTCGNLLVIVALWRYRNVMGFMPMADELMFALYHGFSSSLVLLWHILTFVELREKEAQQNVEAPN